MQTELWRISVDDSVLVKQCQDGDTWAVEKLIVKYQDRIFNTILKICGNRDDAAELTQDTFVKVIEKINSFAGRSSFYTWLFRIAVNLTLNYCKRRVRIAARSLDAEVSGIGGEVRGTLKSYLVNESAVDPAVVAEDRDVYELILKILETLEEGQRAVVVLRDIEGMNYEQISEVLDIELGTVKSRLSRARNNLREIIGTVLK